MRYNQLEASALTGTTKGKRVSVDKNKLSRTWYQKHVGNSGM